ncbi:Hypothetical protein A7982_10662 [Minicystis rosea]|nr:Hypothetical protein A7982_10662 [Minicystis rosea]
MLRSRAGLLLSVSSSLSLALAACGGGGAGTGGNGGTAATGLPCDVNEILVNHCQQCHGAPTKFGAPMPLVTHADLVAQAKSDAGKKVYELVGTRIHDSAAPMPQPPNPPLDAAQQKTLDDWIAAGAPASTDTCTTGPGTGGGAPSCTPDTKLRPLNGYTMPATANDMYICYGVDVTVSAKRHITSFVPYIQNSKIVHHIVLFETDTAAPAEPTPCAFGGSMSRMVAVWAPGNQGFSLPKEAGLPIEGTTHYVLQVHYNNVQHLEGEMDASGFDLCTTDDLRPNDADVLAFGTASFDVPAQGSLDVTCDFELPAGSGSYHVIGAMPHMHKHGTIIETKNHPGGTGAPVDLGSRNPWNFDTQYWTPLDEVVSAGDKVSTRCAWQNPGNTVVHFGENTEDEMCFTFELYYPKITIPSWTWGAPAYLSKCAPTQP